ncbi:MAG: helix-turn-helix transcriptional regulator [Clostridia bacterium]|nr:helix-turn-helix transcriptional regulator [Clostridia bacterium]
MKINEYDYEPIGKRIKQARLTKKYTQEILADKIGVGTQHISDIERGLAGMSVASLLDVLTVLEYDADYILLGKSKTGPNNPINKIISNMHQEQRMYAEELLRVYAKSCGIVLE